MCFYIFSPGVDLEVEYSSETVFLKPFGSSEIYADLLIRNTSNDLTVSHLIILIPKVFLRERRTIQEGLQGEGAFDNKTNEMPRTDNPLNSTYVLSGWKIKTPAHDRLEMSLPNPQDLDNPTTFSGEFQNEPPQNLAIFPGLDVLALRLISKTGFTVFKYWAMHFTQVYTISCITIEF